MPPKRRAAVTASLAISEDAKRNKLSESYDGEKREGSKATAKAQPKKTTSKYPSSEYIDLDGSNDDDEIKPTTRRGKRTDDSPNNDKETEIAKKRTKKDETSKGNGGKAKKDLDSSNESDEDDAAVSKSVKDKLQKQETSKGKAQSSDEDEEEPETLKGKGRRPISATGKGKRALTARGNDKKSVLDVDKEEPEMSKDKKTHVRKGRKAQPARGKGKKQENSDEDDDEEQKTSKEQSEKIETSDEDEEPSKTSKEKDKKPQVATSKSKKVQGKGKKSETSDEEDKVPDSSNGKTKNGESSEEEPPKMSKGKGKEPRIAQSKGKKVQGKATKFETSDEEDEEHKTLKGKSEKSDFSDEDEEEPPKTLKGKGKEPRIAPSKGKKVQGKAKKPATSDDDDDSEEPKASEIQNEEESDVSKKMNQNPETSNGNRKEIKNDIQKPDHDSEPKKGEMGDVKALDTSKEDKTDEEEPRRIRFEYEESPNRWFFYDEETSKEIVKAYESKKKSVSIDVKDETFVVSLNDMNRVNKGDKSKCRIRCCFVDERQNDKPYFSWSYDESGTETYFKQQQSSLLEEAHIKGLESVVIRVKRDLVTVDLQKMIVISKRSTKVTRVLRTKSEAESVTKDVAIAQNKGSKAKGATKSVKTDSEDDKLIRTVVIKGKAPVDPNCVGKVGKAHVYYEGDDVWDAMLNQTNLQFNNNKFYQLQLLEDDSCKAYSVWLRWGRVGNKGQTNLAVFGSNLLKAKETFMRKFYDKTQNHWEEKGDFVKVQGKYDLVAMDYAKASDVVDTEDKVKPLSNIPESMLEPRIKNLIELICNVKAMEDAVIEMKYDAKKSPLGKLTTEQISAGYSALKEIDDLITKGTTGSKLLQACNNFYTRIPHNFGMKTPPLISNKADVLLKIQLLEALGDIQLALKMLSEITNDLANPVDSHYEALNCDMKPLERDSETFKLIERYLQDTHQITHSMYKMEVVDIFECCKEEEAKRFLDVGNRMLLWHGSRLTNWAGILSRGLCIAPPEAPISGYMFGKGVYFADRSSKSANYCFTTKTNNIGILILCEVSLGKVNELVAANSNANVLPKNKNSVKGLGLQIPDPSKDVTLPDGTVVPLGKSIPYQGTNQNLQLQYNEYIVYDTKQIKMKYLLKVKFNYD